LLPTPEQIRTLQRKLYTKAKQQPAYRFYALYDKLHRADILKHAWRLVKANKGSPGIDGIDFAAIEDGIGIDRYLRQLSQELQDKTYRASAVKRVMIPKADGSMRPLGIPTIRDRIVQMALKLVIEPIFDADFCDNSYGFRPEKSAHDAIDTIAEAMRQGHTQVIDADLSKYFDSIPHAKLMATVAERIVDGAVLALIKQWLKAPVMGAAETPEDSQGNDKRNSKTQREGKISCVGGGKGNRRGTPQGGVISPLLSNIYLHLMDRIWQRHDVARKLQAKLVRYADDFVVLCRKDVATPLELVKTILSKLELELNESKTKIVDANKETFNFLGFELAMKTGLKGGRYAHVNPSKKSVVKVKAQLNEITHRTQTWRPIVDVVHDVNSMLRGWTGYFHFRNSTAVFGKVKRHAEERLRIHLRRKHKVSNWNASILRYPERVLYAQYKLYKVPTSAGWKKAHA
jgi:RNA-directed DNA polymerase